MAKGSQPNNQQPQRRQRRRNGRNVPGFNQSSAANPPITYRNLQSLIPYTAVLTTATSNPQSMLGIGTNFDSIGLEYSLRLFLTSTSGLVTTFDQYRFEMIEVFAIVDAWTPPYAPMVVVSSVDLDDTVTGDWYSMSQRGNKKTVYLTVTEPMKKIASFKPRGNYITSATDSPGNAVPKQDTWYDMANLTQNFNGLKVHMCSTNQASVRYFAKARVALKYAI